MRLKTTVDLEGDHGSQDGRWKNMHAVTRQLDKVRSGMSVQSRTV